MQSANHGRFVSITKSTSGLTAQWSISICPDSEKHSFTFWNASETRISSSGISCKSFSQYYWLDENSFHIVISETTRGHAHKWEGWLILPDRECFRICEPHHEILRFYSVTELRPINHQSQNVQKRAFTDWQPIKRNKRDSKRWKDFTFSSYVIDAFQKMVRKLASGPLIHDNDVNRSRTRTDWDKSN